MQKVQYEIHPAATLFPLMTEEEYQGLKKDIAENGQREAVVVWCNKLIDGRNRLRVCEELKRTPYVAELDEDQDPWKYVISHNLHRRHLTTSQRAMVASKLATLKHGNVKAQKSDGQNCPSSIDEAAKTLNVSPRSVKTAKQVQEHGSESVKQAVEQGELPVSLAADLVKTKPDKEEQSKLVEQGTKAVRDAVKKKPAKKSPPKVEEEIEYVDVDDDEVETPNNRPKIKAFLKLWSTCDYIDRVQIRAITLSEE